MSAKAPRTKKSAKGTAQRDDKAYAEFEKLTRRLVRVPKSEIDAERAKTNGNGNKPRTQ